MLADRKVEYIVSEFHQDLVYVRHGSQLDLMQIKKRKSGNWTLVSLINPERKQKQGISEVAEPIQDGKDVGRLLLLGYGTIGENLRDGCSLPDLSHCSNAPAVQHDSTWQSGIGRYTDFLHPKLSKQGIDRTTIALGLLILAIDFTLPHPRAIEASNRDFLDRTVRTCGT